MHDIARACGYSRTTVSAVLNGKAGVTEKARQRVLAAVEQFQYRPNAAATMLVGKPSRLIGVILRDMENPYFTRMFSVLEDRLSREGFNILYFNTREDHEREVKAVADLASYPVAGVILTPLSRAVSRTHLEILRRRAIPCITTERVPEMPFGYVEFRNRRAGALAAEALAAAGHRQVCYVAGPETSAASEQREQGFLSAFRKLAGGAPAPRVIRAGSSSQSGYTAAMGLLGGPQRPTALFCFNDLVAIGVYQAAHALGLAIPRDLSVIGCDDIETAEVLGPALTTISFGIAEVGAYLAETLLEVVAGKRTADTVQKIFAPRVITRQSVGPPPS